MVYIFQIETSESEHCIPTVTSMINLSKMGTFNWRSDYRVIGIASDNADASTLYLMISSPVSNSLGLYLARPEQPDSPDPNQKLLFIQNSSGSLKFHESFHHNSWPSTSYDTISNVKNFFSVGETDSLDFSDNTNMSKGKNFGVISRVDRDASCLGKQTITKVAGT